MTTINFYEKNAEAYAALTVTADMSRAYEKFLAYLPHGAKVLDAGCGSGRDSLFFMRQGYRVTMLDASAAMCRCAEKLTGQKVLHKTFAEINFDKQFDGIWANASLLHVPEQELEKVLKILHRALKDDGVLYASWKYGEAERRDGERFYCDMTEEKLKKLLRRIGCFVCKEAWVSEDVLPLHRQQRWLNVVLGKK
ncbi:MAG: methyltransferase domain-containing protein [Acidaminococcaceae bacterium]|nr:methyltransferase domain-containing protein [Acidaminococcaceae bacterium]